MFFVSPEEQRFKSLEKTATAQRICHEHYTRDEMLCVVPFAMPDSDDADRERKVDDVMYRFDGNMRALFGDDHFWSTRCTKQDQQIKNLISKGVVQTLSDVNKLPELSNTLVKLRPDNESGYSLEILSRYVTVELAYQLEVKQLFQLKALLQFTSRQNEFEFYCQSVIPRGGEFESRSLHSTKTPMMMVLPKVGDTKMFYSLEEIYGSKDAQNLYWHPQKPNFPAADAITSSIREDSTTSLPEFTVYEFTTTEDHGINFDGAWDLVIELGIINRRGLLTLEKRLTKLRLKYVFVVPPRVYRRMKLNQAFTSPKKYKTDHEKRMPILDKAIEQCVITCDDFEGF